MPNWNWSSLEILATSGASSTVWGNAPGGRAAKKPWIGAQAGLLEGERDHGRVGEQVGADGLADGGQLLGPVAVGSGSRSRPASTWSMSPSIRSALLAEPASWSIIVSALVVRTRMLPRWAGWTGLVASLLYLTGQGGILATAIPGFPVWDSAACSAAPSGGSG